MRKKRIQSQQPFKIYVNGCKAIVTLFDNMITSLYKIYYPEQRLEMPFGLCYAEYIELFSLSLFLHFPLKLWKLRGKVVSLQKKSCTRQIENKLSLRSFAFSLQKKSCTRQIESKLFLRSFAFSLQKINCTRKIRNNIKNKAIWMQL